MFSRVAETFRQMSRWLIPTFARRRCWKTAGKGGFSTSRALRNDIRWLNRANAKASRWIWLHVDFRKFSIVSCSIGESKLRKFSSFFAWRVGKNFLSNVIYLLLSCNDRLLVPLQILKNCLKNSRTYYFQYNFPSLVRLYIE